MPKYAYLYDFVFNGTPVVINGKNRIRNDDVVGVHPKTYSVKFCELYDENNPIKKPTDKYDKTPCGSKLCKRIIGGYCNSCRISYSK